MDSRSDSRHQRKSMRDAEEPDHQFQVHFWFYIMVWFGSCSDYNLPMLTGSPWLDSLQLLLLTNDKSVKHPNASLCSSVRCEYLQGMAFGPPPPPLFLQISCLSSRHPPTIAHPGLLCRPFQEVTLEPLAHLNLPHLEHLELRVQNVAGFGADQLKPLEKAYVPSLK